MIDVHCHLAYPGLVEIGEKVVEEAKKSMTALITCGYPRDYKESLELAKKYPKFVFLSLGLHPIDIAKMSDKEVDEYLGFVRAHKEDIVAIGEIGLDRHWFKDEKEQKRFKEVFVRCLELAKELDLPVLLHTRKAEQECFEIVKNLGMEKVVFHCYGGNLTLAKQIIDAGYFISLTTNINNSSNAKDIAKKFPLERLMTETDSPFLSPEKEKPNVPMNVKIVVEKIAGLRKMSFEDVDKQTTENAVKFFGLKKS